MTKKYKLNSHDYIVEVVPNYGMNCIKIVHTQTNTDILKTPKDIDILKNDDAFLFGMPILFFPNRISNGRFEFESREYKFPINEVNLNNFCHGTLHKLPFEVLEYDNTHIKGAFISTNENQYLTFPHTFEMYIEYLIKADGIYQIVQINNTSDKNMPVALGFHTTFNHSDKISLKIPADKEIARNLHTFLPTGEFYDDFDIKDLLNLGNFKLKMKPISRFLELYAKDIQLINNEEGTTITYVFDEKFKYCMLYSNNGEDHVCIEPQTWITDCPNLDLDKDSCGFDYIEPGKFKKYTSSLKVSKI